jgi:hypothetical protein
MRSQDFCRVKTSAKLQHYQRVIVTIDPTQYALTDCQTAEVQGSPDSMLRSTNVRPSSKRKFLSAS